MKSWRPQNWNDVRKTDSLSFESGADAMLYALRNGDWAEHYEAGGHDGIHDSFNCAGTLVFIPDNKDKE